MRKFLCALFFSTTTIMFKCKNSQAPKVQIMMTSAMITSYLMLRNRFSSNIFDTWQTGCVESGTFETFLSRKGVYRYINVVWSAIQWENTSISISYFIFHVTSSQNFQKKLESRNISKIYFVPSYNVTLF